MYPYLRSGNAETWYGGNIGTENGSGGNYATVFIYGPVCLGKRF